jgi:hypothetical protein
VRRGLLVAVVATVVLAVVAGGHWYLARRLLLDPAPPPLVRTLGLATLVALAATLVLHPLAARVAPRRLARLLAWPAALWMGLAFFLLVLVAASDALALLLAAFVPPDDAVAAARVRALGVLGLALGASAAGVRSARAGPVLRRVDVRLARWPAALDGFRIVQLSDLHVGPLLDRRLVADVVARTNALAPDLVAITGDLVDGSVDRLGAEVAPLGALRARAGVFFVTGNHDYYSGADAWVARVRDLGIRPLRNERVTVGDGDAVFDLAGVEDHHAHLVSRTRREDLPRALAGRAPARPVVLLAHDPATFAAAARADVDLQLSGHTHGGQLWPFRWLVRLSTPWVEGLHRRDRSQLWVSRGTGFWGPAMRVRAPAEITELVLRREA